MALVRMTCGCDVSGMPTPTPPVGRVQETRCPRHKVKNMWRTEARNVESPHQPHSVMIARQFAVDPPTADVQHTVIYVWACDESAGVPS